MISDIRISFPCISYDDLMSFTAVLLHFATMSLLFYYYYYYYYYCTAINNYTETNEIIVKLKMKL